MLVIGIDPGIAITGYGIINEEADGEIKAITFGTIITPSGAPISSRLLTLHGELKEIISKFNPATAAIEKLFFQKNIKTAINVGQARGVAILTLAEVKIEAKEYTPTEVKQAVVGYGAADKTQVQTMIKNILKLGEIPRPDDAADALAVAVCHIHSYRINNLYQQD